MGPTREARSLLVRRDSALERGVFRSTRELEQAIGAFIEQHNDEPMRFV